MIYLLMKDCWREQNFVSSLFAIFIVLVQEQMKKLAFFDLIDGFLGA